MPSRTRCERARSIRMVCRSLVEATLLRECHLVQCNLPPTPESACIASPYCPQPTYYDTIPEETAEKVGGTTGEPLSCAGS